MEVIKGEFPRGSEVVIGCDQSVTCSGISVLLTKDGNPVTFSGSKIETAGPKNYIYRIRRQVLQFEAIIERYDIKLVVFEAPIFGEAMSPLLYGLYVALVQIVDSRGIPRVGIMPIQLRSWFLGKKGTKHDVQDKMCEVLNLNKRMNNNIADAFVLSLMGAEFEG